MTQSNDSKNADQVTVLVYKDNLPSKAFRLPLRFVSVLGLGISAAGIVTLLSVFFTIRTHLDTQKGNPSQVLELERKLAEMKSSYDTLLAQQENQSEEAEKESEAPTPTGQANKPSPTPPSKTGESAPSTSIMVLSGILPVDLTQIPQSSISGPVQLKDSRAHWVPQGADFRLHVNFNLYYVATDGASQQGRIVVIGQGKDGTNRTLLSSPPAAIRSVGEDWQIRPEHGEFFSVSRFRKGDADFSPPDAQNIQTLHILILSRENELLIHQILKAPVRPKPAPAPQAETLPTPPKESPPIQEAQPQ